MLVRHMMGYLPSLVIPAIAAFAAVYGYTRILTPEEYGHYTLIMNTMTLLIAVFFYWLQVSIPRLMPLAVKHGVGLQFRVTIYASFFVLSAALQLTLAIGSHLTDNHEVRYVAWLALLMATARAFLNVNQAFHRSRLDFRRYNLIECGQAVIGTVAGFALAWFAGLGATGAIAGAILGMLVMGLVDIRDLFAAPYRDFSRQRLREIAHFGMPLMLSFGLSVIVSSSDRFLIEYYRGAQEVGIYAAGYTLMDRVLTIIFMMAAMPSFPLTVHKLEHEGPKAARRQTYKNGVATLFLVLPACAGLLLTNRQLAEVFIGPAFRAGALRVMPWIALSGLFNGLSTHYFDHAFHLGKRTTLFIYTLGPAALLNVGLNVLLIPRYGYIAAAWSTLAAYMLLLALSITIGRRVFPIKFPFRELLQICLAVFLMAFVLESVHFPGGLTGLLMKMGLGGIIFASGLLILDVMNVRKRLRRLPLSYTSKRHGSRTA